MPGGFLFILVIDRYVVVGSIYTRDSIVSPLNHCISFDWSVSLIDTRRVQVPEIDRVGDRGVLIRRFHR